MAIFNSYNQSGKLLETKDELLTKENVGRYIAEHGEEKAMGYVDALKDYQIALTAILEKCAAKRALPTKDVKFLYENLRNFLNAPKVMKIGNRIEPDSQ